MEILILFLVISSANKIIKFKITKNLYKYFSNSNKISNIFQICFNPILKVYPLEERHSKTNNKLYINIF